MIVLVRSSDSPCLHTNMHFCIHVQSHTHTHTHRHRRTKTQLQKKAVVASWLTTVIVCILQSFINSIVRTMEGFLGCSCRPKFDNFIWWRNLYWQNVSSRCSNCFVQWADFCEDTLRRRTRASSWNVDKISSFQAKLSRKMILISRLSMLLKIPAI